jgi:hypothetical protein
MHFVVGRIRGLERSLLPQAVRNRLRRRVFTSVNLLTSTPTMKAKPGTARCLSLAVVLAYPAPLIRSLLEDAVARDGTGDVDKKCDDRYDPHAAVTTQSWRFPVLPDGVRGLSLATG